MQDENFKRDRNLDVALAVYAAVEPRQGLEQRVLANLRAERLRLSERGWRRWPVLAALAVAVSIAVVSASWRIGGRAFDAPTAPVSASRGSVTNESQPEVAVQSDVGKPSSESGRLHEPAQSTGHVKGAVASRLAAHDSPQTESAAEAAPKLERFPAPEPLSEQEKLLVRFVEDDPQEATLVAEERAEQLQREDEELKNLGAEAEGLQQER